MRTPICALMWLSVLGMACIAEVESDDVDPSEDTSEAEFTLCGRPTLSSLVHAPSLSYLYLGDHLKTGHS
jgi:hypothetical protein